MSIHSGVQAFRDVFRECVCCHRNDWDGRRPDVLQSPDCSCCVKPIHLRHLYVHENQLIAALSSSAHHIYTDPSVFSAVGTDSKHGKHSGYDFPVDVIILCHQDVQPLQIGIIILRLLGAGLFPDQIIDLIIKRGAEKRFADKTVRARLSCFILNVRPVICRNQQNRNLCIHLRADSPDGFNAIHFRHFPINNDYSVIPPGQVPVFDHTECFRSALCRLHGGTKRRKGISSRLKQDLVVVNNQNINRIKHHFITLSVGQGDIQHNSKGCPFPPFALTFNGSAEQIDHLLCNGQAKTGSLNTVDTAVCLTGEGLVHGRHEFRAHTDARICYTIAQPYAAGYCALLLLHINADLAAGFRVFNGVGENVDIDLIQAELVGIQVFLFHLIDVEAELNILFLNHRL